MKELRFIVEPTDYHFSGHTITVKINNGYGWKSVSFGKWEIVMKWLQNNNIDDYKMVVHSQFLG